MTESRYPRAILAGPAGDYVLDTTRPVAWSLRQGYEPVMEIIEAHRLDAARLAHAQGWSHPYELRLEAGDRALTFKYLFLVGETESQHPYTRAFILADVRVWWKRRHIFRRFNVRRRTGQRRRLDADGDLPPEIADVVNDVGFAPYSLNHGLPWSALDAVPEIMQRLPGIGVNPMDGQPIAGRWRWAFAPPSDVQINNIEADDEAGLALQRCLAVIPGAVPCITEEGICELQQQQDVRGAREMLAQMGAEIVDTPHWRDVDLHSIRPGRFEGLLNVEQEVRFDSIVTRDTVTEDMRFMSMVAPVPDPLLRLPDGRLAVQGEWVEFDDLFAAWNADKGLDSAGEPIDVPDIGHDEIREFWLTGFMEALWCGLGRLTPYVNWVARIATIRAHYLQSYRLNHRWTRRVYSWRAYRAALFDLETGTFAKSVAYGSYAELPSERALPALPPDRMFAMLNVEGNVRPGVPLSECRVMPAEVSVLDDELGIIRISMHTDLLGLARQRIPNKLQEVPTLYVGEDVLGGLNPITYDGARIGEGGASVALAAESRKAVVLTAAAASPNNTACLHHELVTAEECVQYVPEAARESIQNPQGPLWQIRINPEVVSARFAWSQRLASQIEESLLSDDEQRTLEARQILVEQGLLQNPDEIREIVRLMGAQVLISLADQPRGSIQIPARQDLRPVGPITAVRHSLVDGVMRSHATVLEHVEGFAWEDVAPASVRRLVLREVQP